MRNHECLFKAGDTVTVLSDGEPTTISKVTGVTTRYVEVGTTKWQVDGSDRYPKTKDSWHRSRLVPATREHADTLRHRRLAAHLQYYTKWSELDLATLRQIAALLPKEEG